MTVMARLKNGDFLLRNELRERLPNVMSGLTAHFPLDGTNKKYFPTKIRYIRDWLNGSTANTGNHWAEIQAINREGTNVALNKTVTALSGGANLNLITDGIVNNTYGHATGSMLNYITIDLGDTHNLKEITVWHYYADSRTYYKTKTEVSEDGTNWFSVFDSDIEGTYVETASGKKIDLILGNGTINSTIQNATLTNDGVICNDTNQVLLINPKLLAGLTEGTIIFKSTPIPSNGATSFLYIGGNDEVRTQIYSTGSNSILIWTNTGNNTASNITWAEYATFTFTWTASQMNLYMNGNLILTRTQGLYYNTLDYFAIGNRLATGSWSAPSKSTIKDISIYNRILNENEIKKVSTCNFSINNIGNMVTQKLIETTTDDLTRPLRQFKDNTLVNKIKEGITL